MGEGGRARARYEMVGNGNGGGEGCVWIFFPQPVFGVGVALGFLTWPDPKLLAFCISWAAILGPQRLTAPKLWVFYYFVF